MKVGKIIETCIYSSDLQKMKKFYVDILGLEFVSEEDGRHVFLKAGKSMLLIFNPEVTLVSDENSFPVHGARTPPSIIHFTLEIKKEDYEKWKKLLIQNNVTIESVLSWGNNSKSIYFHDPVGNLVEFITKGSWPVDD